MDPVATLTLSIYNPIWGNYPHWSLTLTTSNTIYHLQILGSPGTFHYDESKSLENPILASHRKDIKVWDFYHENDISRVRKIARETKVLNGEAAPFFWSCQDWCLDVIGELEGEGVVGVDEDEDDEDLEEWRELKRGLVGEMGGDV